MMRNEPAVMSPFPATTAPTLAPLFLPIVVPIWVLTMSERFESCDTEWNAVRIENVVFNST